MDSSETWKPVVGFEGLYEVSDLGRVRSLRSKGRVLRPCTIKNGYCIVNLGANKPKYIHRLVAQAFIENPDNKHDVDHINRIRNDNRLINLRWATRSENNLNTGLPRCNTSGEKNIKFKAPSYLVRWQRDRKCYCKSFRTFEEAKAFRLGTLGF